MNDSLQAPSERDEIEMLLPWYVTGRLSDDERRRVETWLAHDADLARQVALIEEERHETATAAEALAPSNRLSPDTVLARLPRPGLLPRVAAWVDEQMGLISPVGLRLAAAAALVLIVAQGVAISVLLQDKGSAPYQTASGPAGKSVDGTFVLVRLADAATAAEISKALLAIDVAITGGPSSDGLYRLRVGGAELDERAVKARIDVLRSERRLFDLVIPEPRRRGLP